MGTNRANPAAMILSATMMLRHLGLDSIANSIASATFDVINGGKVRTADMGGEYFLDNVSVGIFLLLTNRQDLPRPLSSLRR